MRLLLIPAVAIAAAMAADDIKFTDITAASGIKFTHNSGRAGKKFLPETLGSGGAFFDADGDGWQDILLINSKDWTPRGRKSLPALYRNNKNGTFTNITAGSGLDVEMYGFGVAVADYDNDGKEDVYITALEGDRLFPQRGRRQVSRRDEGFRNQQRELRHVGGVARLRQGREGGPVRRQLCPVGRQGRSLVLARRGDEIVLHAGVVQGNAIEALSQPGRREVRRRQPEGRRRRSQQQVARRDRARLQRRWLARYLRRQRYAAEQAVSQ